MVDVTNLNIPRSSYGKNLYQSILIHSLYTGLFGFFRTARKWRVRVIACASSVTPVMVVDAIATTSYRKACTSANV